MRKVKLFDEEKSIIDLTKNQMLFGECEKHLPNIPNNSIDLICCDLPYGKTKNKWDSIIDVKFLWYHYWRILKSNGVIVLFGQDKFTSMMMLSDDNHRYNLIWDKVLKSGHLNANKQPMRQHEDIMIFYKEMGTYNPQKIMGSSKNHSKKINKKPNNNNNYNDFKDVDNSNELGYLKHPSSILKFRKVASSKLLHPTEKPIELI